LLTGEPPIPEQSATYQLMCQIPRYDAAALIDLHAYCQEAGQRWRDEVREFAAYLVQVISLWPR